EHNKREKLYANFLYYKAFYANTRPMIITEGKTDITYLRVALNSLAGSYPSLIEKKLVGSDSICDYKLTFFKNSGKTKYFLNLDGGTGHLKDFLSKFDKKSKQYKGNENMNPVIMILDNDSGSDGSGGIFSILNGKSFPNITSSKDELRNKEWLWVIQNLYIIFTPLNGAKDSSMEDLFDKETLDIKLGNKVFNKTNKPCTENQYGKEAFATGVVLKQRENIDFSGFSLIFNS
ncbi:TPA: RNA-directed DNA polymerase, partial [Proteus mirabilis]|nr:RNA-directed DNA polymerase [Proteus mirabilis]